MPQLSIWSIRAALLHLLLGFTVGALILIQKGTTLIPSVWQLLPAHIEMLLFGWTIQLIMGTAFWILPRFTTEPKRGNEKVVWATFFLLNLGIFLVVISPFFDITSWLFFAGRLLEVLGMIGFIFNAWQRVKPFEKSSP